MIVSSASQYTAKQAAGSFSGTLIVGDFFLTINLPQDSTTEEGEAKIADIKNALVIDAIKSLSSLESAITHVLLKCNLPAHVSLAAGRLFEGILYVKTIGTGQVYFRRGKELRLLIDGDKSASGRIQEFDCALFTTDKITQLIGAAADIQVFVDMFSPKDIVEKIQAEQYAEEEAGFAVVIAEFNSETARSTATIPSPFPTSHLDDATLVTTPPQNPAQRRLPRVSISIPSFSRRRFIFLILAFVLFGILVWSVIFGYQRRTASRRQELVDAVKVTVEQKISDAQEEAFLDIDAAIKILNEARNEVQNLKKEIGDTHVDDVKNMEKRISVTESTITKKEDKSGDEFYDFTLEQKSARGNALSYSEGKVAVLDTAAQIVYLLDIEEKSLTKYSASDIKSASLVGLYENAVYIFGKTIGVMKFSAENKASVVIKPDSEWGTISDLKIYNGNLYLLDKAKKTIYKYAPSGQGFGEKTTYLQSDNAITSQAVTFAIDSSVYVVGGKTVDTFIRGIVENLKFQIPTTLNEEFDSIYTDADTDQILLCTSSKGICGVFDKKGAYLKQLQSTALRGHHGIFVREKKMYILKGSTLYTIALD